MKPTLYLVDAHSLIFQVFYAIPPMTAPDGRPTNAAYGFTRDLLGLIDKKTPDYLICVFDAPGKTFRSDLYAEYKANRESMPDELVPQIGLIREIVEAMGIATYEIDGVEADDVVGTIARMAEQRGVETLVCTGDKDARQLISDSIRVYNIRKDAVFAADALRATWGINPEQVIDLLALAGDSVDNVPGVPGIGPKTASTLLQQFGTLDSILENLDQVKGKKQQNLRDHADQARLSRELVSLRCDVPVEVDWDAGFADRMDSRRLLELFGELGFRRLIDEFSNKLAATNRIQTASITIHDLSDADRLAARLRSAAVISIVPHWLDSAATRCAGLATALEPNQAYYIPLDPNSLPGLFSVLEPIKGVLESNTPRKIGHDFKAVQRGLDSYGIQLDGFELDLMLADYLLEAGERSHDLEQMARRYLQASLGSEPKADANQVDSVCTQADLALRLLEPVRRRLNEENLDRLYQQVEWPLMFVLAKMERQGIAIDLTLLEQLAGEFATQLVELERKVYEIAGCEFNLGSPVQLREILFERLGLPVLKKTKTGPSTNHEVLEELAAIHELPAVLIEHRQIAKLKNTYVDAIPRLVNKSTNRLHSTFQQAVAATGRLSSSDPNIQNIPIRSSEGRRIRKAFIARGNSNDWQLIAADYSQIELRILAHFSQDEALLNAFADDLDIHTVVAAQVNDVSLDSVTPAMRRGAKAINFGVIYGLSPFGLGNRLGISKPEAEQFIRGYFDRYSGVERFIHDVLESAARHQYVKTLLGRIRRISGVRKKTGKTLNQPEREAVNTVIQGSAADLIKRAMVDLQREMDRPEIETRLLLQIHDELVFEGPASEQPEMVPMIQEKMADAIALDVPIKVDVETGPNLGELRAYHVVSESI